MTIIGPILNLTSGGSMTAIFIIAELVKIPANNKNMQNWTPNDYWNCFLGFCIVHKLIMDEIAFRKFRKS